VTWNHRRREATPKQETFGGLRALGHACALVAERGVGRRQGQRLDVEGVDSLFRVMFSLSIVIRAIYHVGVVAEVGPRRIQSHRQAI